MGNKVLHILHAIKYSGAEVMLNLASPYFKDKGIELHAVSTDDELGDYAEVLQDAGFTIHHYPFKLSPAYFRQIAHFLQGENFSAVHIHTEQSFFWFAAIAKMANVNRVVYTVHNVFPYKGLVRAKRTFYRVAASRLFGLKITSIGKSVAEVEKNHLFNPTTLVPNWIDEKKFIPAKNSSEKLEVRRSLNIVENQLVIVSVGSCSEQKNHQDILKAIHLIKDQVPNILYLHVGDGKLHLHEQEMAQRLKIEQQVRFLGQSQRIRDILIASDVFVMPSLYEGLGNSLLEALSCGLPSIAYNVYGLRDLIENDINGYLIDSNPEALAKAIVLLASDVKTRERMGKEARTKVLNEYNMHQSLQKLIRLYGIEETTGVVQTY